MTDYQGLDPAVVAAFDEAYPVPGDVEVLAEIEALEKLFGCSMPVELGQMLEVERDPVLAPTPRELAEMDKPFEALILRAQELDDCVSLLFPLTGSVYVRRFFGVEVLGHVTGKPEQPMMPFVGWRRDKWAYDLPSFRQLAMAKRAFDSRKDDELEGLLAPIWRRVGPTEWTEDLFYVAEDTGLKDRLDEATKDVTDLRGSLRQWWRHERALFYAFAMMGKFRPPEEGAFDIDPFPALDNENLTTNLGLQMALLWSGWFMPRDNLLERAMEATAESKSVLVQDARRLLSELLDGRTMVGSVDFAEARRRYPTWVRDPAAYAVEKRRRRREALEQRIEPSEYGIELVRAEWPLSSPVLEDAELPTTTIAWDAETRKLAFGATESVLPEPEPDSKIYLARNSTKTAVSPSGRFFYCTCTVHRRKADKSGWENAPMIAEHDLESGTWRTVVDTPNLEWFACTDEGRWITRDNDSITLLRDLGHEMEGKHGAFVGQPKTLHLPELGVVIAYGSADLVNGRDPDDAKSPWVRVIAYWRDRLACIAAFPVDGVELARDDDGKVGLVAADRHVAWELRNLEAGVAAWREASQKEEAEERAKREAFGPITIDRAVEALNTFAGTEYGPEYQEGVDEAFATAMSVLREDAETVAAAKTAKHSLEIARPVKNAFGPAMTKAQRGPQFMDFALKCTMLVPAFADIVVRAAAASAFEELRKT